jgi:hypothetical protein
MYWGQIEGFKLQKEKNAEKRITPLLISGVEASHSKNLFGNQNDNVN